MQETGCNMSSNDGLIGSGIFNPTKSYKKYNAEHYYKTLQIVFILVIYVFIMILDMQNIQIIKKSAL